MCSVASQRLFSLRLLLQGRSKGGNENLNKWQFFPFDHMLVLEHGVWFGAQTSKYMGREELQENTFSLSNTKYVLHG